MSDNAQKVMGSKEVLQSLSIMIPTCPISLLTCLIMYFI